MRPIRPPSTLEVPAIDAAPRDIPIECEVARCKRDAACRWTVTSVNGFILSPTEAYLCAVHRREAMRLTAALSSRLRRTGAFR